MAILKVRNPKNEWEAVTDIEFNSIRLSDKNITIKLKSNVLTREQTTIKDLENPTESTTEEITSYRLSINDLTTEDEFNDLAYLFDLDSLEAKLTAKINKNSQDIGNILDAYHHRAKNENEIENDTITPDKEYNEYSLKDITSLTINGSNLKRAHGFITFKSDSAPNISYNENSTWKISGANFEDANNGSTWEFDIYPHNNTNYIIWKNWDLVE